MTDQDNLRDRIAKALYYRSTHFAVNKRTWDEEMEGTEGMSDVIDSIRDDAQAIIDEFGLYLQKKPTLKRREADDELIRDRQYRIVGKWEESDEQEPRP